MPSGLNTQITLGAKQTSIWALNEPIEVEGDDISKFESLLGTNEGCGDDWGKELENEPKVKEGVYRCIWPRWNIGCKGMIMCEINIKRMNKIIEISGNTRQWIGLNKINMRWMWCKCT